MKRGDVVSVDLPRPSTDGREQFGRRPAIVFQDETQFSKLPTVIVVPVTSQKSALRFPSSFLIQPSSANGLEYESVVLTFQMRAIDRARIKQVLGVLEPQALTDLNFHVRKLLHL